MNAGNYLCNDLCRDLLVGYGASNGCGPAIGGGGGADGGGGGGSSYTDPTLCSSVVHTQGARTGKGQLTITIL